MYINIYIILSLLTLVLMVKIALFNIFGLWGFKKIDSRAWMGGLLIFAAVWIVGLIFEITPPRYLILAALVAVIALQVRYLWVGFCRGETILDQESECEAVSESESEVDAEVLSEVVSEIECADKSEVAEESFEELVRDIIEQQDSNIYSFEFQDSINRWIESKGFLDKGVTIQKMAAEIDSNRTYLSSYINSTYNTTFREWITAQRVAEAKVLLVNEPEESVSNIALRVGFASVASFSRAFARQEGLSPVGWRTKS